MLSCAGSSTPSTQEEDLAGGDSARRWRDQLQLLLLFFCTGLVENVVIHVQYTNKINRDFCLCVVC